MDQFKNLIVLGPLIYAIHHFEEHIIFNFIEWKLQYFQHSAAALSTEAILSILTCILVVFALLHLVKNNRASAHVILFILFAIQIINAFYHIFFSIYFSDFSPGVITAALLYLPVNFLIVRMVQPRLAGVAVSISSNNAGAAQSGSARAARRRLVGAGCKR